MRSSEKSACERPAEELWLSISRPESPTESSVVQLYAGVLVRDRVNGQDVNLSLCRIDMCSSLVAAGERVLDFIRRNAPRVECFDGLLDPN